MLTEKEIKKNKMQYIRSKKRFIFILSLVFVLLCAVGKITNNYIVIAGATIYAFAVYVIFYNKMQAYVESKK